VNVLASINPLSADKLTSIFRTSPKDPMRIINREGSSIEFKESYSHSGMAQYFKTIAAFANNSGGYIIYGVGDKPRRLLGLKNKNLLQFEELKVEEFTKNLMDYFSPEIKWEHCTFEYKGMSFGVIYTYPLSKKPCICKKSYDDKNVKYTLKEGDIYYRYGGRSERIHYEELNAIIDSARRAEEQQWIEFAKRAAKIGIENACLLDLDTGVVSGNGGSIIIDETLLSKIAFIKEGEFVETKGTPALRLIGDIQEIGTGKIVVKETTKRVVRAIEANDIVRAFLNGLTVEEPLEYLRALCSATSANYPFYFLLEQSKESIDEAVKVIEDTTSRGQTKRNLLARLNGKIVPQTSISASGSEVAKKKAKLKIEWINEEIKVSKDNIGYCMSALMSLDSDDVKQHEAYIRKQLYEIYDKYYENANANIASDIRKAICRVDEVLYMPRD
jgi:hypothetical protein